MDSQPRQPLPRLAIPPMLTMQQPFDGRQPMFSPGLPTTLQQSFHPPPYFMNGPPLQTPMQSVFSHQLPSAPGRPSYTQHRGHASIAHYPGYPPPSTVPMTPLGPAFVPQMVPPFGQPFIPRSRRAPSVNIGGPPKAPLGGPGRKHSPLPPPQATSTPAPRGKKAVVNIPVETISGDFGETPTRPPWARTPVPSGNSEEPTITPPEIYSAESYPPDSWRQNVPDTVDVFLPGKIAWDAIKQRVIEEKLEKLGVERGSGSTLPIHAPHARAASISSPADPSLLHFKLNKLQQSQAASSLNSLSNSPQPPLGLSSSPHQLPPRFQNRHGHSLSLAHPPAFHEPFYTPTAAFNPFGPSAILGSDSIEDDIPTESIRAPIEGIHAPQGRVPVSVPSLVPLGISRGSSRPDFTRGFGLDIPEEEEPQEEEVLIDMDHNAVLEVEGLTRTNSQDTAGDMTTAVALSRLHSRHVSRLSAALSLQSVGGITEGAMSDINTIPINNPDIDDLDEEAVGEWTGSEDMYPGREQSDDEDSIGEWSNPSDEEHARQNRAQRRILRQMKQEAETPRRLPNFPIPPRGGFGISLRSDYDVVSNPSEQDHRGELYNAFLGVDPADFPVRPLSASTTGRRPLPPLPHSRGPSGQYSVHDPALAHSRNTSEHINNVNNDAPIYVLHSSSSGALNPHAKPFIFGEAKQSGSWSLEAAPSHGPALGHSRLPSFGKPLNAAAQEFKPTGFTFRPPPGVPQLSFPIPEPSRPLPMPPVIPSAARDQQGREKRQRRESSSSVDYDGDDSGKENMASFRFPSLGETPRNRRSAPTSPWTSRSKDVNISGGPLQPLTFSGFPTLALPDEGEVQEIEIPGDRQPVASSDIESPQNDDDALDIPNTFPSIAPIRMKRAPIPLDFKNPTSNNTVPAGVFKALVGDEKTRRTVRSRLSSREIFEHSQQPSLDDLTAPAISMSQRRSRSRLVTDPGLKPQPPQSPDIFTPAIKRRSSLPALHSAHNSELSTVSIPAINLTKRLETQALEDKIEALLNEKFQTLRAEIAQARTSTGGSSISHTTEDMITEVVSLFRTQLQESAARGLEDGQMDARGELDLELICDVVKQGHSEGLLLIKTELRELVRCLEQVRPSGPGTNGMEQTNKSSTKVILDSIGKLSPQVEQQSHPFGDPSERHSFIIDLMEALKPIFVALQPVPVDYNVLTAQLSQAVKPNIEQLIDLAADKRETAGLIVDSIVPLLPKLSLDTKSVISQITTEVRRVISPIDAHEIKEQVADLVVERLDSRLAVRDKAFNVEVVSAKVAEGVSGLLHSINDMTPKLDALDEAQQLMVRKSDELASKHTDLHTVVTGLPAQLDDLRRVMHSSNQELYTQASSQSTEEVISAIHGLDVAINSLASTHMSSSTQNEELLSMHKSLREDLAERMNALPETLHTAVSVLQTAHAEFAVSRDASKRDQEEIRKLKAANSELQVQVAKARGAHGQVRVEKDNLGERLKDTESERDRLRSQVEELQSAIRTQAADTAAMESRNSELETALSQSLARLKASDVATQANQERISELEKANKEALAEQANLNSKIGELDTSVKFMTHERDLVAQSLYTLQKEHERLASQQSHWDDLHRATEQIEILTARMSQADNEELKELRRAREKSRVLESEHAALQRHSREQEHKASNAERTANAVRQSLTQAQQRASEWEKRTKEYEGDLEMTRTRLDQAEQAHAQLDADYSLAKLQLEEKEAEDRLIKDREQKLREQVVNLEAQVARLERDLSKTKATPVLSNVSSYTKLASGKLESPPRPDSRSSSISGDRSSTPVAQVNGSFISRNDTPPSTSVWDSMHAPRKYPHSGSGVPATPQPRRTMEPYRPQSVVSYSSQYTSRSVASPTPSTVSVTPDEEGWYS